MASALFREQLIAVREWLNAGEAGNPAAVLDPGALAAANQLSSSAAPDDTAAAMARAALALFWWYRFWALPPGQNASDLRSAVGQVAGAGTLVMPEIPVGLVALAEADPELAGTPEAWASTATEILDESLSPGDLPRLVRSIELVRIATHVVEGDSPIRAALVGNYSFLLHRKYDLTGRPGDLDAAIDAIRADTEAVGPDHEVSPAIYGNFALLLRDRFRSTGSAADLDGAIAAGREAVARESVHRPVLLSGLGIALRSRFGRSGDLADLDEAINAGRDAASAMPPDDPERGVTLSNLSAALMERYAETTSEADLDEAVEASRGAANAGNSHRPEFALYTLARSLSLRFQRKDSPTDLDDTISTLQAWIELIPETNPGRAERESTLADLLSVRYSRLERVDDLAEAIKVRRRALEGTSYKSPELIPRMLALATGLLFAHSATGALPAFAEAVLLFSRALGADPAIAPNEQPRLTMAASRLIAFGQTGDASPLFDSELTVELARLAQVDPRVPPDLAALCLAGWLYFIRYSATFEDQPDETADLVSAGQAFDRVYAVAPAAVPELIATLYEDAQGDPGTAEVSPDEDLVHRLDVSAAHLRARYDATGDVDLLHEAVRRYQQATAVSTVSAEAIAVVQNNLALTLLQLAGLTGELATIQGAVAAIRTAVTLSSPEEPYLPGRLSILCAALTMLSGVTGELAVLDEAVDVGHEGMKLTPLQHPSRGGYLGNLAGAVLARHRRTGNDDDLLQAVHLLRQGVSALDPDSHHLGRCLRALSGALQELSEKTGNLEHLTESAQVAQEALKLVPQGPERWELLERAGSALSALYDVTEELSYLSEAIAFTREAVAGTPANHPERGRRTRKLAGQLDDLHARTKDKDALKEAIDLLQAHASTGPDDRATRAGHLALTGLLLTQMAEYGDSHFLEEAVSALREAAALVPADSTEHGRYSSELADALYELHKHTSNIALLREAVQVARNAVRAPVADDSGRRRRIRVFTDALRAQYEVTGDSAGLDEAINAIDEALLANSDGDWPAVRAEFLFMRATSAHDVAGMREAVLAYRDVLARGDSAPGHTGSIGYFLGILYTYTAEIDLLYEAADLLRRSTMNHSHEGWITKNHLASALELLYERTGEEEMLREAVTVARAAAAEIPSTYAYRSLYLSNLGDLLATLSAATDDVPLLEEAADAARAALLATGKAPSYCRLCLVRLGQMLLAVFRRTGDTGALSEAAEVGRAAVREGAEEIPGTAVVLAQVLLHQHELDDDPATLQEVSRLLPGVLELSTAPLQRRITAARLLGRTAMMRGDPQQALASYELAIELVLQAAGPSLARGDREYGLQSSAGLPSEAAAAAIAAGDPGRAVELLEHGRGVLLGEALHFRSGISQLEAHAPNLAEQFRHLSQEVAIAQRQSAEQGSLVLESTMTSGPAGGVGLALSPHAAERRARMVSEFSRLAERIRAVPGFADFLRPPSLSAMRATIGPGPVVVVNVSQWRCDALLVTADAVDIVPLPGLSLATALEYADQYLRSIYRHQDSLEEVRQLREQIVGGDAKAADYQRYHAAKGLLVKQTEEMEATLHRTVAWLWDVIAEPALGHLGHIAPPNGDDPWPRIWWCPTGALTLLPLHAAGHYEQGADASGRTVIDRVVSSYAPSLRALMTARTAPASPHVKDNGMLVVAMPASPGQAPLPNATRELDLLRELFPARRSTTLVGPRATREAVLSSLPLHRWAHFSCHGDQDLWEPSRGGLLLADGILTVVDMGEEHYQGEFAFLSACKTAVGSITLPDEVITLAAAVQYAGYRHVVATSWSVYDAAAAYVTESLYGYMTVEGVLHPARTAMALHRAVRALRHQHPDRPSMWLPFTHLGP
jgi:tetratricopeptide (TPR) repeat protein